jgi:hypothetical protein
MNWLLSAPVKRRVRSSVWEAAMKRALFAVLTFASAVALDVAAAQLVRVEPAPARATGRVGGVGGTTSTVSGSIPGSSYSGSAPSLVGSPGLNVGPAPQLQLPAPVAVVAASPAGSGGGCRPKTSSECFAEATQCLVNKSLSGQSDATKYTVATDQSGWPYIGRYANIYVTQQEDSAAADCAEDVRKCVTYCR